MITLAFSASGTSLTRTDRQTIAKGTVGAVATFALDTAWDGRTVTATWMSDATSAPVGPVAVTDGRCTIPWEVVRGSWMEVYLVGTLSAEDRLTSGEARVYVRPNGSDRDATVPAEPSETLYDQMVAHAAAIDQQATVAAQASTVASESAQTSEQAATAAATSAQTSEQAATAAATSAQTSEQAATAAATSAQTSEQAATAAATSAQTSEQAATSAEQSLTQMQGNIGVTIASLVDGKLNPAQIPAISINDTFTVASTTEMLALTAQRGDICRIVAGGVITDTYSLAADDATVLSSWLKLGQGYVGEAGHALSADTAGDSGTVGGVRLVSLTQSAYDSLSLRDASTIYLVG